MNDTVRSAATQSGLTVSGGFSGGAITILALVGFLWLLLVLIKKDKLRIAHVIAAWLASFVFLLTPPGQLLFGALAGALDKLAVVAI